MVQTRISHERSPSEKSLAEEISIGANESRFPRILPKGKKKKKLYSILLQHNMLNRKSVHNILGDIV